MFRPLLVLSICVLNGYAQLSTPVVEGEVFDASGHPVSNITIALCRSEVCEEQTTIYEGRFRFMTSALHGSYTLGLKTEDGALLYSQAIYLESSLAPIHITLPASTQLLTVTTAGSVSIQRLSHHPPKAASRELERALASFRKNQPGEGAEHLEKALVADPTFPDAHYLLGLALQANGRNEEALSHLEDAAPSFPKAHIFAAKILSKSGKMRMARSHLQKYVQSGDAMYRDKAILALQASGTED